MLSSQELQYNIVSQGSLRTILYGYPNRLFKLSEYGYEEKLHNMKQLGALQNYLRGAHHTRYEYVFLQWTLTHEMCQRNKGSGLGSKLNYDFADFKIGNKNATKAEILQMLSILTNIGHLPATFTSSSVLLTLLNKNEDKFRTSLKSGLHNIDIKILDSLLKNNDVYKIHLVNSLFKLHRIDRRNEEARRIKDLSLWILREYILRENSGFVELWERYDLIRKVSYLILDSNYAPVPFKLDFSSILMLFDDKESILLNKRSNFQKTLNKMDDVLEETLYLEPNTIIYTGVHKELLLEKYRQISEDVLNDKEKKQLNIKDIKLILAAHKTEDILNNVFKHSSELIDIDWEEDRYLDLSFNEDIISYMNFNNTNELEDYLRQRIGINTVRLSVNLSPSKNITKVVISIKKNHKNKVKKSLDVVKELIQLNEKLRSEGLHFNVKEYYQFVQTLLDFHFLYLFEGKKVKYNSINGVNTPFIYENGSTGIIEELDKFIDKIKDDIEEDLLYEFEVLKDYFKENKFSGLQILYLGGITVLDTTKNKDVLEMDSLILRPNKSNEDFVHILEAKNISKGESIAQRQLENNLSNGLNNKEVKYEAELLSERNAIARLSIIKE